MFLPTSHNLDCLQNVIPPIFNFQVAGTHWLIGNEHMSANPLGLNTDVTLAFAKRSTLDLALQAGCKQLSAIWSSYTIILQCVIFENLDNFPPLCLWMINHTLYICANMWTNLCSKLVRSLGKLSRSASLQHWWDTQEFRQTSHGRGLPGIEVQFVQLVFKSWWIWKHANILNDT